MKTIVQINSFSNGSTGKIMRDISEQCIKQGYNCYNFFGRGNIYNPKTDFKIESKLSLYIHGVLARIGFNGHGSYFVTKKLIKKIKKINPNVIHLHNIHGYYINLKILFNYLKKEYNGKIIWTLHDCWAFTGHCSHFTYAKCLKWQNGCFCCPQIKKYPKEIFDTTRAEYNLKKQIFTGLNNMIIVTPSLWLLKIVQKSFFKKYPIKVINNGINLNIFKKYSSEELEEIYDKYNIPKNKKILLGVANVWEGRKGLNRFIELSNIIDNEYIIVLVGVDNKIKKIIPDNIIKIYRTDNQVDLAKIYNIAYIYLNLSVEESFGMTTIEANACGTPSFVLNSTALPECINSESGVIINNMSSDIFDDIINNIETKFIESKILKHSKKYDSSKKIKEYIDLYI